MLNPTSLRILDAIRDHGYTVQVDDAGRNIVLTVSAPLGDPDADRCIGIGPGQEEELMTRLALDYCDRDQVARVLPAYHRQAEMMDLLVV